MTDIPSSAGPSTYAGRSSSRVKHKSQRALESEDTNRLLSRARAAAAAAARGESIESSSTAQTRHSTRAGKANSGKKGRKTKEKDVWCICKSVDGSGPMIECGECNDWFHFNCIDMDESTAERTHKYVCPSCESATGHKTTRLFDISTFRTPTPPIGLIPGSPNATTSRKRLPAKSKKPSSRTRLAPAFGPEEDLAGAASDSGSDDASSEANHSSAESDSDTGSGSGSGSDSSVHSATRIRPAKKPRVNHTSTNSRQPSKSRHSGTVHDYRSAAITSKGKKPDAAPGGKVPTLPPGRQFVLYKLQDVVKKFFGDGITGEEADVYAAELEAGLFAGFKEVVGGKEIAGARYKTQYTILSSSLRPTLQTRTLDAILSRSLLPSQVALLPSSELASQARADELEKARRESLQQTIRQKEDYTGAIRVGRDGLESVGDERGKVLAGNEERERLDKERRGKEGMDMEIKQKQDDIRSPSADTAATAQAQNRNVQSGQNSPVAATSGFAGTPILPRRVSTTPGIPAAASPLAGRRESTTAPIPLSPALATPDKPTFNLTSAWGADTKSTDEGTTEFDHAVDQSALDLSDLVNVDEEDEMIVDLTEGQGEVKEEERKMTEMDVYKQRPIVFSRGLSNVNDTSSLPRITARLLSNPSIPRTTEFQWRHLLPHDTVEWAGRLPSKTGISFLSQTRFNPKKEVFALGLMLDEEGREGREGEEGVFKALIEEYISRDRYAVYLPYGDHPPPGATKDIYAVPLRPSDRYPDFLDLLDGFKLPSERDGYMWIMVVVLNRDELPPPPASVQPIAPVSVTGPPLPNVPDVLQTQDLQALMRTIGTLPIIPPVQQQQGYSPMVHTGGNTPYPSAHPPQTSAAVYQPPPNGPGIVPYPQTPVYPPHAQVPQSWNTGPEYGYGHPAPYPVQGYPVQGYPQAGYDYPRPDERGWEGKGREGGRSPKRDRERFRGMDRDQGWGSRKRGRGGY